MNKTQALAAMDAKLIRVSAERHQRLEKRQRHLLRLYPALKRAPLEHRLPLFQEARRYASRQWSPYAALGVLLAAAVFLFRASFSGPSSEVPGSTVLISIVLAIVPAVLLHAHIHNYLKLSVDVQVGQR